VPLLDQDSSLGLLKMTAVEKAELIVMVLQIQLGLQLEQIQVEVSDPL